MTFFSFIIDGARCLFRYRWVIPVGWSEIVRCFLSSFISNFVWRIIVFNKFGVRSRQCRWDIICSVCWFFLVWFTINYAPDVRICFFFILCLINVILVFLCQISMSHYLHYNPKGTRTLSRIVIDRGPAVFVFGPHWFHSFELDDRTIDFSRKSWTKIGRDRPRPTEDQTWLCRVG